MSKILCKTKKCVCQNFLYIKRKLANVNLCQILFCEDENHVCPNFLCNDQYLVCQIFCVKVKSAFAKSFLIKGNLQIPKVFGTNNFWNVESGGCGKVVSKQGK